MSKLGWGITVGVVVITALSIWLAVAIASYVSGGGLATDSGHFVKQFNQAKGDSK